MAARTIRSMRLVGVLVAVVITVVLGIVVTTIVLKDTGDSVKTTVPPGIPTLAPGSSVAGRPGIIAAADAVACQTDRQAMQQAVAAYTNLEGKAPADQQALVAAGYIRSPSTLHTLASGQVVSADPRCP